ncbi:MAG TPA: carboxypeptidase regulatory-like domain-containing protein [Terriglobales bacterium]|nr:carboxypeptidase regulatory-like domain-containing protein [Terriglobales bacterium]
MSISSSSRAHLLRSISVLLAVFLFHLASIASAETISGTIHDPSGAVLPGATVEITGNLLTQAVVITSDGAGKFTSSELPSGTYSVRITHNGFEPLVQMVDLHGSAVQLDLKLTVAGERVSVTVPSKHLEFANTDTVYRQLREVGLGRTLRFDNFTVQFDVGTFHFHKGTITLLNPVDGVVTGMIFVGEGHFNLKPVTRLDAEQLKRVTNAEEINEDFSEVVFRFSDEPQKKFLTGFGEETQAGAATGSFERWKEMVRKRREQPLGFTEYLLHGEEMDNVDADLLAAIYNRQHPQFLNAYIKGSKHKDLRFFVRMRVGALPQLDSPEEVALINYDPEGMEDGVWYLAHLQSEYQQHTASSGEDRRLFATHAYKIETIIAKNRHLFCTATITYEPLIAGERVLKFGLLPNLRVTRVIDAQSQDLYYIQESRKEDGSFYVILPEPANTNKEYSITIQYAGDKVLESAGDGSFYVGARTSWYPNLNGFGEHVLFDLTYKVPHRYKVISVGKLVQESTEGEYAVSHWITSSPVAVAGFNYGDYSKVEMPDEITGYKISGYYLKELPDNLRMYSTLKTLAPHAMTKYALEQTRAQLQLCSYYFGKSPYDEIFITEQPDFNFGQSWPNLVYLPISAYTDSTQRWMLFGTINTKFTGFVQEVTPHEVAHQWWGHAVGWASYHDQWLSEGFAEFSAGLFLQQAVGPDWKKDYLEFWERLRKRILEKNNYGIAPNDAGPVWMGLRLSSPRTMRAYQDVAYPKGAYILQMLRSMMYNNSRDKDKPFIDMMHDFVASHHDRPASTESFKAIVEKHMTNEMDFQGNHRMDWFFDEWVYGTQVPRYKFDYQTSAAEAGKVKLHMALTQSEVDDRFAMLVPVFVDFGKGPVRLGQIPIIGSSTGSFDVILPAEPKKVILNAYKDVLER